MEKVTITYDPYKMEYLLNDGENVTVFNSKHEAEFFYVKRFIDYTVKNYGDYSVAYCNDNKTIKCIKIMGV